MATPAAARAAGSAGGFGPAPARGLGRARGPAVHDLRLPVDAGLFGPRKLIIEPFAGSVFGLSPAESARLAGLQHSGLLGGMVLVAVLGSAIGGPRLGSMRLWTIGGCALSGVAVLGVAAAGLLGSAPALRGAIVALGVANGAFSIAAIAP